MGNRDEDREPMPEGPGMPGMLPYFLCTVHWDRGGGEGAWEKRAQAAARPAFDTVLVTCDNWPTTPLPSILQPVTDGPKNLEISSEELPSRPWSYPV